MLATLPLEIFKEAARSAQVGVWLWDVKSGEILWSETTLEIYGVQESEFDGSFESLLGRVHPDDRNLLIQKVDHALENVEQDYRIEHRILTPGGSVRWIEGRGRVIVDDDGVPVRMLGTVTDVTRRRQAEEKKGLIEERLRLFSAHASDYVYDAAVDGSVAIPDIVAGSFERTTGMTKEEVAARGGWTAIIHPDDRAQAMSRLPELRAGQSVLNEYRIVSPRGQVRWVRDRVVPVLDAEKNLVRVVGGVTDITEQKALEEGLIHAQRADALARLAGGVAHDFNNLLTVLIADVSFLRQSECNGKTRQQTLDEIDRTLDRAKHLTGSLLTFGRKQAGPAMVTDVAEALRAAEPLLRRAVGEHISLKLRVTQAPVRVLANPNDLQLVLLNLTLNARDAMPDGGVVNIQLAVATVAADDPSYPVHIRPGEYASITVTDTGAGIDKKSAAQIFDPYFTTKGASGTGLGLPTCLGIAQRCGGSLDLAASSAGGSTFRLLIPATQLAATDATPPRQTESPSGTEHILVVEDDPAVRAVAERVLRYHGYFVSSAGCVEEGLALLRSSTRVVDALLTDVRLPGESGLELVERLKLQQPHFPVLVMSGHVADPQQVAELSRGNYPFLQKPFTAKALADRIREVLDGRQATAQWRPFV